MDFELRGVDNIDPHNQLQLRFCDTNCGRRATKNIEVGDNEIALCGKCHEKHEVGIMALDQQLVSA